MSYGSNWKGKNAIVRYFWRTYIQVCTELQRFAASEVSVAQVFSFNFRRFGGGLRRSFFWQASTRPFSGLPATTTEHGVETSLLLGLARLPVRHAPGCSYSIDCWRSIRFVSRYFWILESARGIMLHS